MSKQDPLFSLSRAKIVTLLKNNPMTIKELQEKSQIPRATLMHHLEHLKKNNIVCEKKLKAWGNPVLLSLSTTADPIPLAIIETYEKIYQIFSKEKQL